MRPQRSGSIKRRDLPAHKGKPAGIQTAESYAVVDGLSFARGPIVKDAMIDVCDGALQAICLRSKREFKESEPS